MGADRIFLVGNDNELVTLAPSLAGPLGLLPSMSSVLKFGANRDFDSTPESLWTAGGIWVPPTTARTHQIVSTSTADTNTAGTGARTVQIWGLNASFVKQTEVIVMNGTSNVPTGSTYTRIFRMTTLTAGSGETNAGTISATADTDGTVTAEISIGDGQTLMAIYTVPDGCTAYMTRAWGTMHRTTKSSGAMMSMSIRERTGIDGSVPALRTRHAVGFAVDGASGRSWTYESGKSFVGPCDIEWRLDDTTDTNTVVYGGFDLSEVTT